VLTLPWLRVSDVTLSNARLTSAVLYGFEVPKALYQLGATKAFFRAGGVSALDELRFCDKLALSERILFPVSDNESNGIEDARFVRFVDDDGTVTYCATYTAYNGRAILPQLIETQDFLHFRVLTLNGGAVQNKGMALSERLNYSLGLELLNLKIWQKIILFRILMVGRRVSKIFQFNT
jgi:hypothetical protein